MLSPVLFCERLIFFDHEYISFVTSFAFVVLGGFGWYHHSRANYAWLSLFAWMTVMGIGSAWLHFDGYIVAGYIDVGSMFFLLYASLCQVLSCVLTMFWPVTFARSRFGISSHSILFVLQVIQFWMSLLSVSLYYNIQDLQLVVLFGIPAGILWVTLLAWSIYLYKISFKAPYQYVFYGLTLAVMATIIWTQTESRCTDSNADPSWVPYLFGHAWWHVLLAFASYYLIIFSYFVYLKQNAIDAIIGFPCCGLKCFPVVQY